MKGRATQKFVMSEEYHHKTPKRSVQMDCIDENSDSIETSSDNEMELIEPMVQASTSVQNESICDNQVAVPSSAIASVVIENNSHMQETCKNDSDSNGMNGSPLTAIICQLNGIEENMDIDSNDSNNSLNGNNPMELCDSMNQATAASSNPIESDDIEIDSRPMQNDQVIPVAEIGATIGDSVSSRTANASMCGSADDESSSIDSFHGFSNGMVNVAFEMHKMINANVCNIGQGNGSVLMVATSLVNNLDTDHQGPNHCGENEPTETIDHGELIRNLNTIN